MKFALFLRVGEFQLQRNKGQCGVAHLILYLLYSTRLNITELVNCIIIFAFISLTVNQTLKYSKCGDEEVATR